MVNSVAIIVCLFFCYLIVRLDCYVLVICYWFVWWIFGYCFGVVALVLGWYCLAGCLLLCLFLKLLLCVMIVWLIECGWILCLCV